MHPFQTTSPLTSTAPRDGIGVGPLILIRKEMPILTLTPTALLTCIFGSTFPAVENGMPLAGTGPRFTLTAISGLDKAMTSWSFDLHMNDKRNVSIDEVGEDH